jgi:ribokinase
MSDRQIDIIGVGRAVMDHAVLVDPYPESDSKTEALAHFHGAGSPVPNALCQAAKWGWSCSLVAGVGDDAEGRQIEEELTSCSVETSGVTRRQGQQTPRAYIWVEKGTGKRTVVLDRTLAPLSPDELPFMQIEDARFLLVDGYEADANLAALKTARDANVETMIDAGAVRPRMEEQLKLCDWLIVPVSFVRDVFGDVNLFEVVSDLRKHGARGVVVTNGAGGCVASWEDEVEWFQAYPVEAVDTTGAGDIFHAGFLHGRLNGWDVPDCVRWASAAAALSVTALGGRGRLAAAEEVRDFLCEHDVRLPSSGE